MKVAGNRSWPRTHIASQPERSNGLRWMVKRCLSTLIVSSSLLIYFNESNHAAELLVLPASLPSMAESSETNEHPAKEQPQLVANQVSIINGLITVVATPLQDAPAALGSGVALPTNSVLGPNSVLDPNENVLPKPKLPLNGPPHGLNPASPQNKTNAPSVNGPVELIPGLAPSVADPPEEVVYVPMPTSGTKSHTQPRYRRIFRACGDCLEPFRPINLFDSGLTAAVETTFLTASTLGTTKVFTEDLLANTVDSQEVDGGIGFGQRVILGLQSNVFGLEVIYWNFEDESFESGVWKNRAITPQFGLGRRLDLETLDLGITQRFCLAGCRLTTSLGLRMMDFNASEQAHAMRNYQQGLVEVTSAAILKRAVDAVGPTLALRGTHSAWPRKCACGSTCNSGCPNLQQKHSCSLYWNTRLSWLWAEQSTSAMSEAMVAATDLATPAVARSRDAAITTSDETDLQMQFGLQAGIEFCRRIGCRSKCVLRGGFEYQYFDIGSDYTASTSTAFLTDDSTFGGQTTALAQNEHTDLHMFGISFTAGVNY